GFVKRHLDAVRPDDGPVVFLEGAQLEVPVPVGLCGAGLAGLQLIGRPHWRKGHIRLLDRLAVEHHPALYGAIFGPPHPGRRTAATPTTMRPNRNRMGRSWWSSARLKSGTVPTDGRPKSLHSVSPQITRAAGPGCTACPPRRHSRGG